MLKIYTWLPKFAQITGWGGGGSRKYILSPLLLLMLEASFQSKHGIVRFTYLRDLKRVVCASTACRQETSLSLLCWREAADILGAWWVLLHLRAFTAPKHWLICHLLPPSLWRRAVGYCCASVVCNVTAVAHRCCFLSSFCQCPESFSLLILEGGETSTLSLHILMANFPACLFFFLRCKLWIHTWIFLQSWTTRSGNHGL